MRTAHMIIADGRAVLTFPYDEWLIEALKEEIPAHARSYDPASRAWTVFEPHVRMARNLITFSFPDVEIEEETRFRPPSERQPATPHTSYTVLHLQPTAPPELVEVAYRTLTKLYHPDAGGDTETMAAINEAVSIIRRRVAS